jgi:hypothetical protein
MAGDFRDGRPSVAVLLHADREKKIMMSVS